MSEFYEFGCDVMEMEDTAATVNYEWGAEAVDEMRTELLEKTLL